MTEETKEQTQSKVREATPEPAEATPAAGSGPTGRQVAVARRGGVAAGRKIVLARQQLSHGAKSLKASAGPFATKSTAIVKRRTTQVAVRLRRLNRQRTGPALSRSGRWIVQRLHPRSIGRDYRRILLFVHNRVLDWGIDSLFFVPTRGRVRLVGLSIPSQVRGTGHDYRPTPSRVFRWAMSVLPEPLNDRAFVDYGAGRGRVLLMASHYPFEKICGAEIARELHESCEMNIAQYPRSLMKCRDVECELGRATTFPTPGQRTVFYFFDPFDRSVFEKILARIARSYKRDRRELHLICIDMDEQKSVEAQGIFHPVRFPVEERLKIALFSPYSIRVYKTDP